MPQDTAATTYIFDSVEQTRYLVSKSLLPKNFDSLDNYAKHAFIVEKYNKVNNIQYTTQSTEENYGDKIADSLDQASQYFIPMFVVAVFALVFIKASKDSYNEGSNYNTPSTPDILPAATTLTYYGNTLNFSRIVLTTVLFKHFPFYNSLDGFEKDKFINRLEKFIESKTFIIHDESGFREMPILISASAIQLTFGLEKYLLPYFDTINIYPQEFLGVQPFIRFLEGNVSGNTINLSWKHFLEGFQYPEDGENVGLHEMSHALYYQTFVVGESVDKDFKNTFESFNISGNKAFAEEHALKKDLYSDYAMRNFQEFWAESIEIFFEKPVEMRAVHPELYAAMSDLLNQSPADRVKT